MSRFPSKGMRAIRAEFPDAERIVQLRLLMKDGSFLSIEGPVTVEEAKVIAQAACGQRIKLAPSRGS